MTESVDIFRDANDRVVGVTIWQVSKIISDAEEAAANYVPDQKPGGLKEFYEFLKEGIKECEGKDFIPAIPFYCIDMDFILLHFEDTPNYAKWINHDVTHVLADDDNRIMGVEIFGVKKLIERANEQQSTDATA